MSNSLAVIPTYVRNDVELGVTIKTIETLRQQEPDLDVFVIDDCSPYESKWRLDATCQDLGVDFILMKEENEGFSHTVNHGMRQALEAGQNTILVNADIEFVRPFVEIFEQQRDSQDRPAAVVGALLLYPNGLIQHAGVALSFYERAFDHKYRYGPGALPEAHQPAICPVTGALQFIRHSTLESIGVYDEEFRMGFEDVDYCLRTFEAGLECVYQPAVVAIHHESLFRGQRSDHLDEWHAQSVRFLREKHGSTPLGRYVMPIA